MMTRRRRIVEDKRADAVAGAATISARRFRSAMSAIRRSLRKPRRMMRRERRDAGFTLVEVIVALAILSIGLSTLLGVVSSGLRQTADAKRMAEAGSLAQSLLAEVGTERPVKPEERDGEFPNGYRWRLKMQPFGDVREREEWPVGVYAVSTEVEWDDGAQRRSYALTTLRLGPKAVRQ